MLEVRRFSIVGLVAGIAAFLVVLLPMQKAEGAPAVKVCGSGYGHGVGLSQYGAYGRASAGQGYGQIVKSYYRGVALKKLDKDPTVRVLLGEKSLSGNQEITVRGGRKGRLKDLVTGKTTGLGPGTYWVSRLADRGLYRVTRPSDRKTVGTYKGPVRFEPASGGPLGYGRADYRGNLIVQVAGSKLYLVNQLPSEAYIRGVVANEMPSSWPAEALKSQAVAARSYARATERSGTFDFYADTRDQVYKGVSSETPATNRAVSATARTVAVHNGRPIKAFFHSASGGYTEDSSKVFGSSPYLKAVRDADGRGKSYESRAKAPWTGWSGYLDPNGSQALGVGSIKNVRVLERSPSGRALKAEVTGTRGKKIISGQYDIRYGLKSKGLKRANGSSYPAGVLPSARVNFGPDCGGTSPTRAKPALYRSGTFYLKNTLSGGPADNTFDYGGTRRGTVPLMGDWNADGKKTAGIYRSGTFYLKNSNKGGKAEQVFPYGKAGDKPVVGDWNGDGRDTVGIVRGGSFYLKNANRGGRADIRFSYGKASDRPVVGDWDGDGKDSVGIVRGGSFYLKNANRGGRADILFSYGKASDRPVVGDWDGDGKDSVGIVRDGGWYLKNANRGGKADVKFVYGNERYLPLVGG